MMLRAPALIALVAAVCASAGCENQQAGGDAPWRAEILATQTIDGVGAAQGVTVHAGRVYVYGDADSGVIREYGYELEPTPSLSWLGREAHLTHRGEDWLPHPTGIAIHPELGTHAPVWIGDAVRRKGVLHRVDWDTLWATGTLDHALIHATLDDLAVNGCRPEWVRYGERWAIATSDYGDESNAVRLYNPDRLGETPRTSAPDVLIATIPCGPYVQTLEWLDATGELLLVQNVTPGLGCRLTAAAPFGRELIEARPLDIPELTGELKGFAWLQGDPWAGGIGVMVSAGRADNVHFVRLTRVNPP